MTQAGNYIVGTLITLGAAALYERFVRHDRKLRDMANQELIQQFLLGDGSLEDNKPILWIHITHEKNARWWQSFYSRNTDYLNQPYMFLAIRSIIRQCGASFNVCLIDDESFTSLVPGWTSDVSKLADPARSHVRSLALSRLLHAHGGMLVPSSFVCMRDLLPMYEAGTAGTSMFVCENQSSGNVAATTYYFPGTSFMGCVRGSVEMQALGDGISAVIASDHTAQPKFTGEFDRLCYQMVAEGRVSVMCGGRIGVKKQNGEPLAIEELMGDSYVDMPDEMSGLYIPADKILRRTKYQWFARLSASQALSSNTMAGRYLLICHASS